MNNCSRLLLTTMCVSKETLLSSISIAKCLCIEIRPVWWKIREVYCNQKMFSLISRFSGCSWIFGIWEFVRDRFRFLSTDSMTLKSLWNDFKSLTKFRQWILKEKFSFAVFLLSNTISSDWSWKLRSDRHAFLEISFHFLRKQPEVK